MIYGDATEVTNAIFNPPYTVIRMFMTSIASSLPSSARTTDIIFSAVDALDRAEKGLSLLCLRRENSTAKTVDAV